MIKERFTFESILPNVVKIKDGEKCLTCEEVVDVLNSQDMQIFLLKCVIQTITAESMDKNISHKRIIEIKRHWYDFLYGGDLNDSTIY